MSLHLIRHPYMYIFALNLSGMIAGLISLILGNQLSEYRMKLRQIEKHDKSDMMIFTGTGADVCADASSSRATLIVVPTILLGQWWRERRNNVAFEDQEAGKFEVALISIQKFTKTEITIDCIVSTESTGIPVHGSACLFTHEE